MLNYFTLYSANPLLAFSDKELRDELYRRKVANEEGRCDVCGNGYDSPTCGSPRHADASAQWYQRWYWESGSTYLSVWRETRAGDYYMTVSRYGTRVSLFHKKNGVAETNLPSSGMADEDQIKRAVEWAEGVINAL